MTHPVFLIADTEYIIAMEAERILRDLFACTVAIVNPRCVSACANLAWTTYTAVLLDTGFRFDEVRFLAELLQRQGIPVIFTTANADYAHGVPGFPTTPVLNKPYAAADVAAVIVPLVRALRRNRANPVTGLLAAP